MNEHQLSRRDTEKRARDTERAKNSNIVSGVFGASLTTAITTITALANGADLGNTLSTACSVATPMTIMSPLVSYISGPECKIKAKPFAIGALGGLALTFSAAVFDHYNPEEAPPQNNAAMQSPIVQNHRKIA